jgi:zinc/manganese transport system permease protein
MALATGLAVAEMWAGLATAYYAPRIPPSFAITAVATAVYAIALAATRLRRRGNAALLETDTGRGAARGRQVTARI